MSDSPDGRLQSASTHQPPARWNRPVATSRVMSAKRAGSDSRTHSRKTTDVKV
jgi:hypothetical protein